MIQKGRTGLDKAGVKLLLELLEKMPRYCPEEKSLYLKYCNIPGLHTKRYHITLALQRLDQNVLVPHIHFSGGPHFHHLQYTVHANVA